MKKAAYILIAISCICSTAIALYDNDTDVKYLQLFTNNGKDVIKEYEHIDSITYSKYDKDGVKQDSYMTQEIWTKDSVYRNSLLSIDSLKVDQQPYYVYCSDIQEFIAENIKVDEDEESVKGKIENYLANSSSVTDFSFDETYGYYSIEFDNGGRADITLFNMEDAYSATKPGKFKNNINKSVTSGSHYDVSYIEGEEIQDNNRLLYLWAGEFWTMENFYPKSEIDGIKEAIDNSPVDIKVEVVKNDVSILDRFNDYGAIVISQTHGRGDGAFYLCSRSWVNKLGDNDKFHFYRNYVISLLQRKVVDMVFPWFYYTVTPQYFTGKSFDYPFIYGNYCWSRGLGITGIYNSCFVGYDVASNFLINDDMSISYFTSLFNGQTHQKSVDNIGGYAFQNNWVEPATNHNKPYKRYFSILMNDVEEEDNGDLVISGKINGFKNLKKDVELRLYYAMRGTNSIGSGNYINLPADAIDANGNFKIVFHVKDYSQGNNDEFKFQVSFKYKNCYYNSEVKNGYKKWMKLTVNKGDTIYMHALGLKDAEIISVEGAENDEYWEHYKVYGERYIVTSEKGQVLIKYDGKINRIQSGLDGYGLFVNVNKIRSFITNDEIQEIGTNVFENVEVFECPAVKIIAENAFSKAPLKEITLSGVEYIGDGILCNNDSLRSVSITGDKIYTGGHLFINGILSNLEEIKLSGILWVGLGVLEDYENTDRYNYYQMRPDFQTFMYHFINKNGRNWGYCDDCKKFACDVLTTIFLPESDIEELLNYYRELYGDDEMNEFMRKNMGNYHNTECKKYRQIVVPIPQESEEFKE